MSSYNRKARLEMALEKLVDCFDTGGETYTLLTTNADGEEIDALLTNETTEALEEALNVLYDGTDQYANNEG